MKALYTIFQVLIITAVVSLLSFFSYPRGVEEDPEVQDTVFKYSDGLYEGQSRQNYTDEPYWGKVLVRIENGSVMAVRFVIRDSNLHETFNQDYEKHFAAIPEYVTQCRNDWKGVQTYPSRFLQLQDINKVDAVTGATWSCNIFKAAVDSALKKATRK